MDFPLLTFLHVTLFVGLGHVSFQAGKLNYSIFSRNSFSERFSSRNRSIKTCGNLHGNLRLTVSSYELVCTFRLTCWVDRNFLWLLGPFRILSLSKFALLTVKSYRTLKLLPTNERSKETFIIYAFIDRATAILTQIPVFVRTSRCFF